MVLSFRGIGGVIAEVYSSYEILLSIRSMLIIIILCIILRNILLPFVLIQYVLFSVVAL